MKLALISDVFFDAAGPARMTELLRTARSLDADLAVLPELPLNSWCPATPSPSDADAEPPSGPRHQALAAAAREAGLGVIGGAIVREPASGRRHNTALVFDRGGAHVGSYRKLHLPEEDGFWEIRHYEPGDALPGIIDTFGVRMGLQICSDANRPEGCHLLGALGAEMIVVPRATEAATFDQWRTVFIANAITSTAYFVSVNRPREERGVRLGGPSIAVAPTGEVLVETTDTLAIVSIDRAAVVQARRGYPGYLATRAELYAEGWQRVKSGQLPHE
jgi:N-carbamoylputrescine amidase